MKNIFSILLVCSILQINGYSQSNTLTNKQYREFTNWVRDSIIRSHFAAKGIPGFLLSTKDQVNILPKQPINWKQKIDLTNYNQIQAYKELLYGKYESLTFENKGFNTSLLKYSWQNNGLEKKVSIYPDTLCWVRGQLPLDTLPYVAYTNDDGKVFYCNRFGTIYDALAATYLWHPYYDNYPVVGINEEQLQAYSHWCSNQKKPALNSKFTFSSNNESVEIKDLSISHWLVTQKGYSEFASWVADSIAMRMLGEQIDGFLEVEDKFGNEIDPPILNWGARNSLKKSKFEDEDTIDLLENLFSPKTKLYNKLKIEYEYCIWDLVRASSYESSWRSDFISRDKIMVFSDVKIEDLYKDTVIWGDLSKIKLVDLHYNNAYAYYNWLQHYSKKLKFNKNVNPVSLYLLPNRVEWNALKTNGKIAPISYKIAFPTPVVSITN